MLICEMCLFDWYFFNSAHLICPNTDISKCFRGSLRLRDNESRLYVIKAAGYTFRGSNFEIFFFGLLSKCGST